MKKMSMIVGLLCLPAGQAPSASFEEQVAQGIQRVSADARQVQQAMAASKAQADAQAPMGVPAGGASQAADVAPPVSKQPTEAVGGTGWFDANITIGGKGYSNNFTKSSCLFCWSHQNAAVERAEANAFAWLRHDCEKVKKGFVVETPSIIGSTKCERVDGWTSYYVCGAQASGSCRINPSQKQ